ncbi:MAG TPA: NAD(P)H-dependent glycerol-3-phosphate dehydrogenase, partial [Chitinophagaceae bacterium]|nr:NAD(P)H-dependent glycerol-3-phosphate dehydrogenase [Chitinophagaceae bacterium]
LNLENIKTTLSVEEAVTQSQLAVFALPSAYLEEMAKRIKPEWIKERPIAVSIKSFVPGTGYVPAAFLAKHFRMPDTAMILSGPCHAEEIALERNTYLTIAGHNKAQVAEVADSITAPYVRCILNEDPVGVQYAAILKNIVGIATGIASGLHYGENFMAVLASNAMREIKIFLNTVHKAARDLHNSAYFGDVLVTAYSDYSRNRTLGKLIGRGLQVTKALQSMEMVAEGYYASKELAVIARQMAVSLPIINSVYRILHEHANPFHEFKLVEKQLF